MRESLGRTLHSIAQVLDSFEGSELRVVRVLEHLREIVSFEQCALLRARPGREAQLFVQPPASEEVRTTLEDTLVQLHQRMVSEPSRPARPEANSHARLAVPLVGNDQTIGVLLVRRVAAEPYTLRDLRELSVVGGQLAAYLVMVDQARQLDDARRQAEAAVRTKDEFLAMVSHELRTRRNVHAQGRLFDEILDLASSQSPDPLVADPVRIVSTISGLLLNVIRATPALPGDPSEERGRVLAGVRVLLVDDDPEMRQAAAAVLELHGAEVTAVSSAAAALATLAHTRPHVLLSDLLLSGDTGYDLMREVSARNVVVPAAAITSLSKPEDRARALAAGFTMHITKPFHAEALVAAVVTLAGPVERHPHA